MIWYKKATWLKKSIDDPREESITADSKEDPVTEDSKRALSMRTLKRILSMKNLKRILSLSPTDNSINVDPQELQDPQWLLRRKLTLFGFLVMVYDRVGD